MKVIEPKVELWEEKHKEEHVAKCARVCYRSKSTGEPSDIQLCKALKRNNHMSMFRHSSHYYVVPESCWDELYFHRYRKCPYIEIRHDNDHVYVVANDQFVQENFRFESWMAKWENSPKEFIKTDPICKEMMRYTFKLTTQLSTARELNRKSPNNISEASTRYIRLNKEDDYSIVRPHWITKEEIDKYDTTGFLDKQDYGATTLAEYINDGEPGTEKISRIANYLLGCQNGFYYYENMFYYGAKLEDARGVLPLDTATEVIYTYSIKEWKDIINARYFGTTGKPHPNCKIIIGMVKEELEKLGYEFGHY